MGNLGKVCCPLDMRWDGRSPLLSFTGTRVWFVHGSTFMKIYHLDCKPWSTIRIFHHLDLEAVNVVVA